MFELSVACKYLLPRRRQLSVSIISLISILVISLVVWLIVVFFSVTDGLEKSWISKLTALTAPIRITPTEPYYHSYYYQVDSLSEASNYTLKPIKEKLLSNKTDPYNSAIDEEVPTHWLPPDLDKEGQLKDLVKLAYLGITELQGVSDRQAQDFEITGTQMRLHLLRPLDVSSQKHQSYQGLAQSQLTYPTYLGNFDPSNTQIGRTLLPIGMDDLNNILNLTGIAENHEEAEQNSLFSAATLQQRLQRFFKHVDITQLKTRLSGWRFPSPLFPAHAQWDVYVIFKGSDLLKVIVPTKRQELALIKAAFEEESSFTLLQGQLIIQNRTFHLKLPNQSDISLTPYMPIVLMGGSSFSVELIPESLAKARRTDDLKFSMHMMIQGVPIQGIIPYRGLEIADAQFKHFPIQPEEAPIWVYQSEPNTFTLPQDELIGEGVVLPKSFKDAGVLVGDRGFLSYVAPTASMIQEQHLPIYVASFYDPGIIPIGGKFVLANRDILSIIRSSHEGDDRFATNGINVRFANFKQADEVKSQLQRSFKDKGIGRYWNIETYREFEFTKEIMRELQSQKNIFLVISIVIILVACSNIISMLIILVNDKKVEIGILRSMGASSKSIAFIFGLAGALIGIIGSLLGIGIAILTLKNIEGILGLISRIQGYDLFNSAFYGEEIPRELSYEALSFVLIATVMISLLAGIVPAVKACLLRPSTILRANG